MGIAHRTGPSDVVSRADFWIPTLLLAFGLTLVASVLFSQTPPSGGGASAPAAGAAPAGASSGAPAPTTGRVDPTKAEARKPRIRLESYERSGEYLRATYNFFFKNQGDDGLTLNDWDLCLVGWEAPYVFDVRLVGDDKSRIVDLGPIDYLAYRPTEAEAQAVLSTVRPNDAERAVIHPGHVYLIHTLDRDADYTVKVKVLSIAETGRADILGETIEVKRKPTAGTPKKRAR